MGLDFSKSAAAAQEAAAAAEAKVVDAAVADAPEQQSFDIVEAREEMNTKLVNSPEVDALVSTVDINDMSTIVGFGAGAAEEISKVADTVLKSTNMKQIDESAKLMEILAGIMQQFDIDEIREEPSKLRKLFGKPKDPLDKVLMKYHTMGGAVDEIYVQLKQYEEEIKQSNRKLALLFDANVGYYQELVKYILAGEQACKELEEYIKKREADLAATGDNSIHFELQNLNQALMMMEQRTQDLRTAESIAMQSVPMLKTMEFSNYNLVRKISSAFIITLPVFKQALAQAILLKRQKIQAESMAALDAKTNELLIKNAQNTVDQSKMTARLASGSSISVDTLETTWKTIMDGIEETKQIEQDARKQRIEDKQRLEAIKDDFRKRYATIDKPNQ
ncbi:Uncharacterized conserved protein YaaN involved in tellurite resistance [Ruminococcus sp. YE71]|uniref:toxic anion resistance protein n=1 Tax=unclassified Ruminococcus TaxID=2608920 RepID=UPI0008882419|nr:MULTISPECIES: toxic anion resistance protein [unclassified Ruminococcus]SDA10371.1 Uncharacterized conserved protein YaaN involved in tellurite resistance [Ruminococcus sp. YE78]SFW10770.1 Uncharacterized conserved protein YaaN involved in tellurite resistance [Ruminococcus sp. YE71]